ncbi:MAG: PEP-CTERM sorting domain-containing protein [Parahaliea sp.]
MKTTLRSTISGFALFVAAFFSGNSMAGILVPNAGWTSFCFDGVGSGAYECGLMPGSIGNSIELEVTEETELQITDVFSAGDIFEVYIDSMLAFTSSTVADDQTLFELDPELTFASAYFSSGSILLSAGIYSIDIFVASSPYLAGGGYLRALSVATAVPAPSVLGLLVLGLLAIAASRRISHRQV